MKSVRIFVRINLLSFTASIIEKMSIDNKYLILAYDDFAIPFPDGEFAQLQRKIAIHSICNFFRCKYSDEPIKDLMVTPLDSFQTKKAINAQLRKINKLLEFKGEINIHSRKTQNINLPYLNLRIFLRYYLETFILKKIIKLNISNPYPLIELNPKIYEKGKPRLSKEYINKKPGGIKVAIHIRRGVSSNHITPGEQFPRALPMKYFVDMLKNISESSDQKHNLQVLIFTDAPSKTIKYKPLSFQKNRNVEFSKDSSGKFRVIGEDFAILKATFPKIHFKIYRGGDPISAFRKILTSDHFVMSRSSLSFTAALYHQGKVYYPPNFWHKKLKNWISI